MFFSFFIVLLAGISVLSVDCLTCLHCTDIQSPRHCKYVRECQPGEVCNIHRTTNPNGDVEFDVSCVHPWACSNRSQGLQACDECCSTDLCNAAGCGLTGYPSKRGPVCFNCPAQITDGTCHRIDVCGLNEMCLINEQSEFGDTVYTSQCVGLAHCQPQTMGSLQIIGRSIYDDTRSLAETVCHKCCHDDLCNANCEVNYCASNPCGHGTCVNSRTNYTCVCDPSYTGRNCTNLNYCSPNPCEHGICVNGKTNYTCACDPSHIGRHCAEFRIHDCMDQRNLTHVSGVYSVLPAGMFQNIEVYCDMQTDGGGLAVFQRRVNGSVDFYQNFLNYENGFGDVHGEFWLGLKYIHAMTANVTSELRIELETGDGHLLYEVFPNFRLSAAPEYTLHIEKGHGTAGDSHGLSYSSGTRLSTYDNEHSSTCAHSHHAGGWLNNCGWANLNGRYVTPGSKSFLYEAMCYGDYNDGEALKGTTMMFRRV
ncbi:neurogenic locus notch homolog protein 2-like isoform X1 [Dreissena polymorpha]|uniref:neurogenic locus notch homolog protein 2-like isoform X1 n=1 Tax=Dreissena polymorpha TaxID=45954 RepID=UPI002264C0BB|nr:neurogenic locus notch homolog protein 2-like isoform X1 [Dreissena polymorpha]